MPGIESQPAAVRVTDVRVLLVDDEEMSRRGFSTALDESQGITLIGSTRVGDDLYRSVRSGRPDVVLLNSATDNDWIGAVRELLARSAQPEAPRVIVVTGADDRLLQAVQAGAAGVLLRNVSVGELGYAVRHVAAGHSVISPAATSYVLARLRVAADSASGDVAGMAAIGVLSRRERQILAGLAAGRSNREIAFETRLTVATVKSHVSSILTKLDVRDRLQAALLAQRAGMAAEFTLRSTSSPDLVDVRAG